MAERKVWIPVTGTTNRWHVVTLIDYEDGVAVDYTVCEVTGGQVLPMLSDIDDALRVVPWKLPREAASKARELFRFARVMDVFSVTQNDFRISISEAGGPAFVSPLNEAAKSWLAKYVATDDAQWQGETLVVAARQAAVIAGLMREAGYEAATDVRAGF